MPSARAVAPEDVGTGKFAAVTASAVAFQAATEGIPNYRNRSQYICGKTRKMV